MIIQSVIIDDEALARNRLKRMLKPYDFIRIAGEAGNGKEALEVIGDLQPRLLFLDIRMPLLSGFEMLEQLHETPYIIFTTAYHQYALQAFEENAVDYLLKPVSAEKLDRAVAKVSAIFSRGSVSTPHLDRLVQSIQRKENRIERFSVKTGDRITIIPAEDILYFFAEDKYTFAATQDSESIISFTLKDLEQRLDPVKFIRIHRGAIVNIAQIQTIGKWFGGKYKLTFANGKELMVSASYAGRFRQAINL